MAFSHIEHIYQDYTEMASTTAGDFILGGVSMPSFLTKSNGGESTN